MDFQQQRGVGADGALIVPQMRSIGGANFDQGRTTLGHHLRHAEGAADFDQFAARDDDLSAVREGSQRQQHRCGIIVHGEGGLGSRKTGEQRFNMLVTGSPPATLHIDLERGVPGHDRCHRPDRRVAQRSAAEIGMDDNARGVHGPSEAQRGAGCHQRTQVSQQGSRGGIHGFGAQQARPGLIH